MRRVLAIGVLAVSAGLAGCATPERSTQTIHVKVTPARAQCTLWHDDRVAGIYNAMLQTMIVKKSRDDLLILCTAEGYKDKRLRLAARPSPLDAIGLDAIDFTTDDVHSYDSDVIIAMERS